MEKLTLDREKTSDEGTFGRLLRNGYLVAYTCELPWKENMRRISCIPKGTYRVTRRNSEKFGDHFLLHEVENRDYILIHAGNTILDILGCIAVGDARGELRGRPAVLNSKATMKELLTELPEVFELEVTGVCG